MSVHINAKKGDFAKVLLMPGDPVRATWIAHTFLKDYKEVCDVRGMLGYTGYTKNGKRISVMASGMGQPSIGIYSYELFKDYDVQIYYLNTDDFSDEDNSKFIKYNNDWSDGYGTPMLLLVGDNKIIDIVDGATDTEHYIEFLKGHDLIKG